MGSRTSDQVQEKQIDSRWKEFTKQLHGEPFLHKFIFQRLTNSNNPLLHVLSRCVENTFYNRVMHMLPTQ